MTTFNTYVSAIKYHSMFFYFREEIFSALITMQTWNNFPIFL